MMECREGNSRFVLHQHPIKYWANHQVVFLAYNKVKHLTILLLLFECSFFAYAQSGESNTVAANELIAAFKQGRDRNNCAAIALIKAAMGTFGANQVFHRVASSDSHFDFVLRNKDTVRLSPAELKYAIAQNGFQQGRSPSSERLKKVADTCFAIMCKRKALLHNNLYDAAVIQLNNGYKTRDIAVLLGLRFKAVPAISPRKLAPHPHLVIYNYYHAAYAAYGYYDFAFGASGEAPMKSFRWNHKGQDNVYNPYLCDIREALMVMD